MDIQNLYVTLELQRALSEKQQRCLFSACEHAGFELIILPCEEMNPSSLHDLFLLSESCLLHFLNQKGVSSRESFLIWVDHASKKNLEPFKDSVKNIRFIFSDLPSPVFETLITSTLKFFKNKSNSHNVFKDFIKKDGASFSAQLKHSSERSIIQKQVTDFFLQQIESNKDDLTVGAQVYAKNLSDILDEFLMNAIWDANPKYLKQDRSKATSLEANEYVDVSCLYDGINFLLSVTDYFGSFPSAVIEKYVYYALGMREKSHTPQQGVGAGLGLFMILQKIGVVVFEIKKGHYTRATVIARGDQAFREMQQKSRAVFFYEEEG